MPFLTDPQVETILARLTSGARPYDLAREFGVSYQSIYRVRKGIRNTTPRKPRVDIDTPLFERYSVDENGCWLYTGYVNRDGYGVTSGIPVHRLFFERFSAPLEADMQIDHLCGARSCVNVAHLEQVSQKENLARAGFGLHSRAT